MPETFTLTTTIPASPGAIYDAWLDGRKHGDMTGGEATCDNRVGGMFSAWGGYIEGINRELVAARRIVQDWRSSEFPPAAPDSRLEITLEASGGLTRLTLKHSNIPDGQGSSYKKGWEEHYFIPMREYFARRAQNEKPKPRPRAAKKGKARKS